MDENQQSKLVPSLIGGAAIAVLSTFPVISAANCLCCLWVIAGGFLSVYIFNNNLPDDGVMSQNDALILGLLSGIFGALFATFLSYFFLVIGYKPGMELVESLMDTQEDIAPEVRDMLDAFRGREGVLGPFVVLIQLGVKLVVYVVFSTIGGVIGGAVLNKKRNTAD